MGMKSDREIVVWPYAVCFAIAVLGFVFPAIFFREWSAWAILFWLAPMAIMSLFGLWLLLDGIAKSKTMPK